MFNLNSKIMVETMRKFALITSIIFLVVCFSFLATSIHFRFEAQKDLEQSFLILGAMAFFVSMTGIIKYDSLK